MNLTVLDSRCKTHSFVSRSTAINCFEVYLFGHLFVATSAPLAEKLHKGLEMPVPVSRDALN